MRTWMALLAITGLLVAGCASAASPPSEAGGPLLGKGDGDEQAPPAAPAPSDRLIVRVGSIELQVSDVAATYQQARQLALRLGGYVGDSEFASDREGRPSATVVLRIPAERYDEALDALRPLATKVLVERSQETDVTSQVVDLDARIANLRASEAALVKIFERAGKISEVLEVQRELTSVREQIEKLVAERQLLATQAALATLTVTLSTTPEPISSATESWDPGAEVERALAQLIDVAQAIAGAAIWLGIVVFPVAVVGLVLLLLAVRLGRRFGFDLRPRRQAAPPGGPPA
jgi:hypothetical protein